MKRHKGNTAANVWNFSLTHTICGIIQLALLCVTIAVGGKFCFHLWKIFALFRFFFCHTVLKVENKNVSKAHVFVKF